MRDGRNDMTRTDDDDLDALLRAHVSRELDPHLGHATAKLDRLLAERATARPRPLVIGLRWSAAATVLLGLGVTLSLVAHQLRPAPTPDQPIANPAPRPVFDAVQTSWVETYDDGTVLVDEKTPARMLRRVQYEQTDWKDAQGQWQCTITVPQQDVILLDLPKQ